MTALCDLCQRPDPTGGYICPACADRARRDLRAIAEVTPAARAVAAGVVRRGTAVGGRRGGIRLQLNLAAAARLDRVQTEITTLARHVMEERGEQIPAVTDPLVTAALWLVGHIEWLRHRREAAEQAQLIALCRRTLVGVADGPAERRWLGQCGADTPDGPCRADLHARIDAEQTACRECGARHDVAERRAWLAETVRGYAYTASEIEQAFGIKAGTIRQWAHRGRIVATGTTAEGWPVYPLGAVLDLAAQDAARRAERQVRRAVRAA